jgi:Zn-dependent M28 family amino/carboxypeptidase
LSAYAYVEAHRRELEQFKLMLNLDGAGRGAEHRGFQLQGDRTELIMTLRKVGKAMGSSLVADNGLSLYSDHFPFMLAGVPAASYATMDAPPSGVRGWGHTAADTPDKVSPANLQAAALHVARIMLHLSSSEDWPARLQTQAEVEAILKDYRLDEVLKLELRYPSHDESN